MMSGPEGLGSCPCFEGTAVFPYGVRRVKGVILGFGTFEQMELNETRHLVEIRIAGKPDSLARMLFRTPW